MAFNFILKKNIYENVRKVANSAFALRLVSVSLNVKQALPEEVRFGKNNAQLSSLDLNTISSFALNRDFPALIIFSKLYFRCRG